MNWNQDIFKEMANVAIRAPSVHNVQPWKLRFTHLGFDLFQSKKRRLHVGDPRLHDNDVSLGSFIELCCLFLKRHGLEIQLNIALPEIIQDDDHDDIYEARFNISLTPIIAINDPLFDYIFKRKSYRGIFSNDPGFDENILKKITIPDLEILWITGPEEMKKWALIYDEGSAHINKISGYFNELIHWLRFDKSHPKFDEDGLNFKALSLGSSEAAMAKWLFNETVFKFLSLFSLEKLLITEAPQIKSAQGILVIYASERLNSIEMGRAFMRLWLTLTSHGISVCPLSTLVDFTGSLNILNSMKTSDATICLNVLRFGKVADEKIIYSSPRLGIERIIIK